MKWGSVKWFLIVCLLAADCYLGVQLSREYMASNTVSREAIEDAAAVLAQSGIAIDADVIPTDVIKEYVYRIPIDGERFGEALSAMTESSVSGMYMQPSSAGMSVVFENGDSAEYYQNLFFSYTRKNDDKTDIWKEIIASYREAPALFSAASGTKAENAARSAETFLTKMTEEKRKVGGSNVRLRPHRVGVYRTQYDSVYLVVFNEMLSVGRKKNAIISGTEVWALLENDTIWYLSGTWIPFAPDETYTVDNLDQLNILFSEGVRTTAEPEENDGTRQKIVGMERACYLIWDNAGNVYLRPAWQLQYDKPTSDVIRTVLYDAITGDVIADTEQK